jgi:threonylcarbamoyladenosine tRNA methylthiotransferase MtaB
MQKTNPTAAIYTLGCRVNQYESQSISESLTHFGVEICDWNDVCDIYVINTCAVTKESGRKSQQMIRQAHKRNPQAAIFVTGCEAQLKQEALLQLGGVVCVCGNANKMQIVEKVKEYLQGNTEQSALFLPLTCYEPMRITQSERTRAYVKIQDGCNGKCAYCIIPRLRGPVRSRPIADTLNEIRVLAQNGYREVVLTGIETAAYQDDLATLMEQVNAIDGIERIRLGSMDPSAVSADFIAKIASLSCVMPHFHLSLQSGCDATLSRMRRRYNTSQIQRAVDSLRQLMPSVQFTADIIVGFPGETEEEFEQTYQFLQKLRLSGIHIFPYSIRPQTEAATMPHQVEKEVKSARLARLEDLKAQMWRDIAQEQIGTIHSVLFEQWDGVRAYGHTEHFLQVAIESELPLDNRIASVRITEAKDGILHGIIAP